MKPLNIIKNPIYEETLSIKGYFNDIKKLKGTTKEEEQILGERILQGDRSAINELATRNIKIVITIAKQYQNQGISLEDLISEGNKGLMYAAETFDYRLGYKFSSYCFPHIRQSQICILNSDSRLIKVPVNRLNSYNHIRKFEIKFEQENHRPPTYEELSEHLNIKLKDLQPLLAINEHCSLEINESEEESYDIINHTDTYNSIAQDTEEDADIQLERAELKIKLNCILASILTCEQIKIIDLSFGITTGTPEEVESICRIIGCSKKYYTNKYTEAMDLLRRNKNIIALFKQL